jgi:hypothetical protein
MADEPSPSSTPAGNAKCEVNDPADGQNFENRDGRRAGEWRTRYPDARLHIYGEAIYLAIHLFAVLGLIVVCWLGKIPQLGQSADRSLRLSRYIYAWLAGTLGGTMFSIKWLYHSVARYYWNQDRRLWRLFTPHLSGALALMFLVTARSGLLNTVNLSAYNSPSAIIASSFLVGYFSDSAIGKLKDIAETLFGHRRPLKNS